MTSKNTVLVTVGAVVVLAVLAIAAYSAWHKPTTGVAPAASPSSTAAQSSASPAPTPVNQATASSYSAARCQSTDLTASINAQGGGTAGTQYRQVVLANHSGHPCNIEGFPGVSLASAAGAQLGQPAARDGSAGPTITLAPGHSASAAVGFPNPGNFAPGVCSAQSATLRIYPPNETTWLSPALQAQYCPGFSVQTLVAN